MTKSYHAQVLMEMAVALETCGMRARARILESTAKELDRLHEVNTKLWRALSDAVKLPAGQIPESASEFFMKSFNPNQKPRTKAKARSER